MLFFFLRPVSRLLKMEQKTIKPYNWSEISYYFITALVQNVRHLHFIYLLLQLKRNVLWHRRCYHFDVYHEESKENRKKKNTAMLIYWTPHWLRPTLGTAATKKQQQKGSCLFGFCSSLFFFFSWCHLALLICALTFDWDYDTVLGSLNSQIHSIVATPGFVFVSDWRRIKWCWAKWILIASNGMWGDLRHLE